MVGAVLGREQDATAFQQGEGVEVLAETHVFGVEVQHPLVLIGQIGQDVVGLELNAVNCAAGAGRDVDDALLRLRAAIHREVVGVAVV